MWELHPTELFSKGGPLMWPLLAASVLALAVVLDRLLVIALTSGSFRRLNRELEGPVRRGDWSAALAVARRSRLPAARLAESYMRHRATSPGAREELLACEASQRLSRLEGRLIWLSIIGHLAPMIGLLGTVTGLIGAFHAIELNGGQVQPTDLAEGIWSALLTTVAGLIVALPTLAAHSLLQSRVERHALEIGWLLADLNRWSQAPADHSPRPAPSAEASPAESPTSQASPASTAPAPQPQPAGTGTR